MSVFLSPVGGAAAQFFDNNGVPLTGGKLFTYAGGTTTPQASYTTIVGDVAHTNPIILDSAGRVPGGEIWLTDQSYKFVLNDADNVLIATYDNIFAISPVSALAAATTPLTGSEILSIVQSGTISKVSVANLTAGRAISASAATITGAVTAASAVITNNSASAALQIIQTGAGDALLIEDSASPDATPFVVKADGNVGIGTATPTLPLNIGNSTLPAGVTIAGQMISSDVAATTPLLSLRRSAASGNPIFAQFTSSGTEAVPFAVALNRNLGRNDWWGFDGANYSNAVAITAAVDGVVSAGVVPGRLVFSTAITNTPIERMRLTYTGNLYIGETAPASPTKVAINWDSSTDQGITLKSTSATFTASPIIFLNNVNAISGSIGQAASTVSYNTSSDYRLKENIAPMTGALAKVAALKPCTYTWKIDGVAGQGFIAHELQEVIPDCVTGAKDAVDKDGNIRPQGVDTSFLVATLTAAIQEQQAMIVQLQADVAALKSTN